MTLDLGVLHSDFWEEAGIQPSDLRRGGWDDLIAGLVVFPTPEGEIPVELIVGRGYAAKFAIETAVMNKHVGCPVVTPLGLALLKLEAGGTRDINDILALQEAQKTLTGWDLVAAVSPHVPKLSRDARASWQQLHGVLVPAPKPTVPSAAPKIDNGRSR